MTTEEKPNIDKSFESFSRSYNIPYAEFDGNCDVQVIIPIEEKDTQKSSLSAIGKARKTKADFSLNDALLSVPVFVEFVGDKTISSLSYFFRKYGSYLVKPFAFLWVLFMRAFTAFKANIKLIPSNLKDDIRDMRYEIKLIRKQTEHLKKRKRLTFFKAMRKYTVISFSRHSLFWKTVVNTALPVIAVIAVAIAFGSAQKKIYALKVTYNGVQIGYIENENVFEEAKSKALRLLVQGNEDNSYTDAISYEPEYKVSRISLNDLNNEDMICENIITASNASLERACGIYIDGDFICAVKNETDASSVFSGILAPYKKKADEDTIVAFVEEVRYVQGLYPESSIWDSMKLKQELSKPRSESKYHTVQENESAKSIAKANSLTLSQLKTLNKNVDFSSLTAGTKLLVAEKKDYVRVKVMKTRVRTQTVAFETVKQESSSLAKGTTKVYREGRNGKIQTTELVTYINGVETYSTTVSKKQVTAPVSKIILIGTKTISYSYAGTPASGGTVSSGTYGKMIWPTRGAYSISSRFGYRSPSISGWSFHGGVDIVKAGGGSTGTPVIAAASGTVVSAVSGYSGYGHCVVIDHGNGLRTRYAHMQAGSICVYPGQKVYQGQQIGRIGGTGNVTGPHLHFEVLKNGTKVNPLGYIG